MTSLLNDVHIPSAIIGVVLTILGFVLIDMFMERQLKRQEAVRAREEEKIAAERYALEEIYARQRQAPKIGVIWFDDMSGQTHFFRREYRSGKCGLDMALLPADPNVTIVAARAYQDDPSMLAVIEIKASDEQTLCEYVERLRNVAWEVGHTQAFYRYGDGYLNEDHVYTDWFGKPTLPVLMSDSRTLA